MHKHFLASVFLLSLCLGCGTGEYESRIGGHHGGGGGAAGPDLLGPAEDWSGTRVSVRVPHCMAILPPGADPKRARNIPTPLPTMQQRVYEGFVTDRDGGKTPFYWHILVMDVPKAPGVSVADQLKKAMAKDPANAPKFADFQAVNSEGKETKWQMAHSSDKGDFYYKDKNGVETLRPMDEAEEMYVHEDAGYFVFIAWRVPSNIEQNIGDVGLAELAKAVAGGVTVKPQ
jgi:hypothetical protein